MPQRWILFPALCAYAHWRPGPPGCTCAAAAAQGIMNEVELLKDLNHRNIVKYLGSFRTKTHLVGGGAPACVLGKGCALPGPAWRLGVQGRILCP